MTRGVPNYGSDLENEEGGTQRWNEIGRAEKVMKGEAATEMEPDWQKRGRMEEGGKWTG